MLSAALVQRHYDADLPIGGATDWLSFRPVSSNMALVKQTAALLTQFMKSISPKQKARPLDVEAALQVVEALRAVNVSPIPLTGEGIDVYRRVQGLAKFPVTDWPADGSLGFFANQLELSPEHVRNLDKHIQGPALAPALEKINEAMVRENVQSEPEVPVETIPLKHRQYTVR